MLRVGSTTVGCEPGMVMVTGAGGQVGAELVSLVWPKPWTVVGLDRSQLDIANPVAVHSILTKLAPKVVINAAAYTAVDQAEDNADRAWAINADAVGQLARATERVGSWLIQLSTDYVFDGTKDGPYVESDPVSPLGTYGRTKRQGERQAFGNSRTMVLRTAWVYSSRGPNFVRTICRLAQSKEVIGVVDDQVGSPTSASELAATIAEMVCGPGPQSGLYHLAAPDPATWWELADEALRLVGLRDSVQLNRLTTAEYPTRAPRPANSQLDSTLFRSTFGLGLSPWRSALSSCLSSWSVV